MHRHTVNLIISIAIWQTDFRSGLIKSCMNCSHWCDYHDYIDSFLPVRHFVKYSIGCRHFSSHTLTRNGVDGRHWLPRHVDAVTSFSIDCTAVHFNHFKWCWLLSRESSLESAFRYVHMFAFERLNSNKFSATAFNCSAHVQTCVLHALDGDIVELRIAISRESLSLSCDTLVKCLTSTYVLFFMFGIFN